MGPNMSWSLDRDVDLTSKVALLTKIPLFAGIGASNLVLLASSSKVQTFHSREILFRQGDVTKETYIIISGEAEVITEEPEGETTVATIGQHQFIGEIATLLDVPRTATVVALTHLATLVISKEEFYRIVTEDPFIGIEVMRELARRLFKTTTLLRGTGTDGDELPVNQNHASKLLELTG